MAENEIFGEIGHQNGPGDPFVADIERQKLISKVGGD